MIRRLAALCGLAALLAVSGTFVRAGSTARVGAQPVRVLERPNARAAAVATMAAGAEIEILECEDDWCWVLVDVDHAGTRRAGWVRAGSLDRRPATALAGSTGARPGAAPTDTREVARAEVDSTSTARRISAAATSLDGEHVAPAGASAVASGPPVPEHVGAVVNLMTASSTERVGAELSRGMKNASGPGTEPPPPVTLRRESGNSLLAAWVQPKSLRAAVDVGYEGAGVDNEASAVNERVLSGRVAVSASAAILDPRILTIDFTGDLQLSRTSRGGATALFGSSAGLRSYRLDVGILSGRGSPLRVFADRVSSDFRIQPLDTATGLSERTSGLRTGAGFTWDVNVPRLPRLRFSATVGRQADRRNYLFGSDSTNTEQRAEVTADQAFRRGRYTMTFTHGAFVYDVPGAGVRSDTNNDQLFGTGHIDATKRLTVDLGGRASRFQFGVGSGRTVVDGVGVEVGARYRLSQHVSAGGRYSLSSNSLEAVLSGELAPREPGVIATAGSAPLRTRTLFQDGSAHLDYTGSSFSASMTSRSIGFGVPYADAATLAQLRTVGGSARAERRLSGVTVSASAEASVGRAASNRGQSEDYREAGVQLGVSRNLGRWARFGADGGYRRAGRLAFFPVSLDTQSLAARVETLAPGWARLRVSVTRTRSLRDATFNDTQDRHTGLAASVSGGWYELTVDINQQDTSSMLLASSVLGGRPDVALLVVSRPDLLRSFIGASDRNQAVSVGIRPLPGLQVNGRVRRQTQQYPLLFDLGQRGEQAWVVYQVREIQLEFGWERFESNSSFSVGRDRRFFVRFRRNLTIF